MSVPLLPALAEGTCNHRLLLSFDCKFQPLSGSPVCVSPFPSRPGSQRGGGEAGVMIPFAVPTRWASSGGVSAPPAALGVGVGLVPCCGQAWGMVPFLVHLYLVNLDLQLCK